MFIPLTRIAMRPKFHVCIFILLVFVLFCAIQPMLSQIVGCGGPGLDCPSKADGTDSGVCSHQENGVGVVSFDSNAASDEPLTWTVLMNEESHSGHQSTVREFFPGTPPSLNPEDVTDFGACSMAFWNLTSDLRLPPAPSSIRRLSKFWMGHGHGNRLRP